jgi:rod shape-determining protein MreD
MRLTGVLVSVSVAVLMQALIARYTAGARWTVDLVLVGVIYAALRWGPVAGMLAGTLGGLVQDLLAGDVVGVGGLAKTLVGFAAGAIGAQFVLVRPQARMIIVAVATVLHRIMMLGLYSLIESADGGAQRWPAVPWTAILLQAGLNAACALVVFQATEVVPGALERSRANRRASLNRRKW